MDELRVPSSESKLALAPVDQTRGYWRWFSFGYYYGSPAVLAEQEVRTR